jgi:hypothetical protein
MRDLSEYRHDAMRKRRKKTHPIARLIETILDLALISGLLSAVGFLISNTTRLIF